MSNRTRRQLLQTVAAGTVTALAGCGAVRERFDSQFVDGGLDNPFGESGGAGTSTETGTPTESDTPESEKLAISPSEMEAAPSLLASMPVQEPTDETEYAIIGTDDPELTVTFYGSWKCAKTRGFVLGEFETLLKEYVEPGTVAIEFRHIAYNDDHTYLSSDAPNAGNAGLAVWHNAPETYAEYFGTVFKNQPPSEITWASLAQLVLLADHAGVGERGAIKSAIKNTRYESALQKTSNRVQEIDIESIPRIVVNGTVTVPRKYPDRMYQAIEDARQ